MRRARLSSRWTALLCAALLLATGTVGMASADPDRGATIAAKKKCKKAKKGAAEAKKRCKKKRHAVPAPPVSPTPPASLPASLSISPTSHNFGTVLGDSGNQTFTVTNSGGSPSGALASSVGGNDPGNFVISTDTCDGTVLGAGAACTVDLHCSNPEANGVTRTATLTVGGSPGGSPYATLTCFETT